MINHTITDFSNPINATSRLQPKIYIACLTSHLEGTKHGVWVDAHQSVATLEQAAQAMLATSPAGKKAIEWKVLETEGFGSLALAPYTSLKTLAGTAAFLAAYGALGEALIKRFSDDLDSDALKKSQDLMTHHYHGVYPSKLAFVEHFFPVAPPLSLRIEPPILHKLITEHLFILYFFTLNIGDQWHVFNYPECTTMKPITLD